ncbi:MAG: N-6 DNA methylase [Acidobacteriota bacterium]
MAIGFTRSRSTTIKKRRGIFYTPSGISELLASWAIRSPNDRVLEPSFGGCTFLAALERRFRELEASEPWDQMCGCDLSSEAFSTHLAKLIPSEVHRRNFIKADFLKVNPESFGREPFQAIIGNPPYVSYHNMFKVQRRAAAAIGFDETFRLPRTGNLWSYFVFHSIRFLAPNGRMAWLLPTSVLQAEYGRVLLDELRRRFERVAIISLQERLFDGTNEGTEILLCDRLSNNHHNEIEIANADGMGHCRDLLNDNDKSTVRYTPLRKRAISSLLASRRLVTFRRIARSPQTVRLRDVARLSIGVVTGANELFVISDEFAASHGIPKHALKPILAKIDVARGLRLLKSDFRYARGKGLKCLLVDASADTMSIELRRYFSRISVKLRKGNVTFGKRADWRVPDAGITPDAFLPYMHHTGPRLILNACKTNSTNTIHRLYFNPGVSMPQRKLIAISMLSTFSQISAEIEGRSYGSGVLKHELREAGSIQLLLPTKRSAKSIATAFKRIDHLLRSGDRSGAQSVADRFIGSTLPEALSERSLTELRRDLAYLRRRRHQRKRNEKSKAS